MTDSICNICRLRSFVHSLLKLCIITDFLSAKCFSLTICLHKTFILLNLGEYLVNKPLQAATLVYWRIMPKAERLLKNEQLAEKRSFEGNCEILSTIFSQGHYPPIYQQARKGFIYFITLRFIFTTRFIASKFIGKTLRNKPGLTVIETNVS